MPNSHQPTEYELRQQKKEERREAEKQKLRSKKIKHWIIAALWLAGIGGVMALGVWWVAPRFVPKGADDSVAYPIQVAEHIAEGSQHPPYNSNPPSSGWHYASPALLGFYDVDEPSPSDEKIIHNLEHGSVWIAYHPRIPDATRDALQKFDASKIIITPREANDTDIALVAWGRVDTFNLEGGTLDTGRIENFIKRYTNRGPEKVGTDPHR